MGRRKFNCKLFIINKCETAADAKKMVRAMLDWIVDPNKPLEPMPDEPYALAAMNAPDMHAQLGRARNHHKMAHRLVLSQRPPAGAVEYRDTNGSLVVSDDDNDRPSDTRDLPPPPTPSRRMMQPRPKVRSSQPTTPPRPSRARPLAWSKRAAVPPADNEAGHDTGIEDRAFADAVQADVDRFLADATDHTDGDAHDADASDGSAIPAVFRRSTAKPTLESVGIRKPSRPRRRRKRAPPQEWQAHGRPSGRRARRHERASHDDDDDDDGDEGANAVTEMIFNEWEKKILDNGGDVLCIAEAFLLAQYSDYAYHQVYACIDKFAEVSARKELRNPPGYLHKANELTRRNAENQVGLQADHADRQWSTRPNIYHHVANEFGWDSRWSRSSQRTWHGWVDMRDE